MPRLNYTIPLYFDQSLSYLEMLGALASKVEDIDEVFSLINQYFTFDGSKITIKGDLAVTGELDSTTVVSKANEANKLSTPRKIELIGVVDGDVQFDGSEDVIINTSLGTNSLNCNISGNANTATKLQTPRSITLAGNVTGTGTFDGSGNLTITTQVTGGSTEINSTTGDFTVGTGTNGGSLYTNSGIYSKGTDGNYVEIVKDGQLKVGASTADKLSTARMITLSGDVSGSASFDGSASCLISTTCGHATKAEKVGTGLVGGATQPVYVKADGTITACTDYSQASVLKADKATKLETARTISISGDCEGSATFDGSANTDIEVICSSATVSETTNQIQYGTSLPSSTTGYATGTVFLVYTA